MRLQHAQMPSDKGLYNTGLHVLMQLLRGPLTASVWKYPTLFSVYVRVNGKIMSDGIDERGKKEQKQYIKKTMKLKDEVRMAGSESTQTRL